MKRNNQPFAFERFIPTGRRSGGVSAVSLSGKRITFLGETRILFTRECVVIFYDRCSEVIGIQPADPEEEGAIRLCKTNTSLYVSAKSFFRCYDIPSGRETVRYPAQWDPRRRMLLVSINSAPAAVSPKALKKARPGRDRSGPPPQRPRTPARPRGMKEQP